MSNSFDDARADEAFIEAAKAVAGLRDSRPDFINTEMVYGLLQVCACLEQSSAWREFLRAALDEVIEREHLA